jgi:hypothetical protein
MLLLGISARRKYPGGLIVNDSATYPSFAVWRSPREFTENSDTFHFLALLLDVFISGVGEKVACTYPNLTELRGTPTE